MKRNKRGDVPNTDFSQADLDEVCDSPSLTSEDFAKAQPLEPAMPGLAAALRARGRQKAPTKVQVSLRLDRRVVDHFRKSGTGWQTRINDALLEVANSKFARRP